MRIVVFCLLVGLCYFNPLLSQDTLLLLNGKELPGRITDDTGVDILFEVPHKHGKSKVLRYQRAEIYSFRKGNGKDTVLYQKDPLLGFDLDPREMRYYMYGQSDARNHRTLYNDLGGFAFGLGTTLFLEGGAVPFMSPVVYSLSMQIPVIKVQESAISDKRNTLDPQYLEGYNRTARSKKFVRGFLSTMVGVLVGSGIVLATQ